MNVSPLSQIGGIREIMPEGYISPEEFRARAFKKAAALLQLSLSPGQRVVLAHGNSINFFIDLAALWLIRCTAVPMHPLLTDIELDRVIEKVDAKLVLVAGEGKQRRGKNIVSTEHLPLSSISLEMLSWPSPEEECLILFSSGSTGAPKAIKHTWGTLSFRIRQIQEHLGLSGWQNALCFLPTSFGHGLIANCLSPWLAGKTLHLLPGFQPLAASHFPEWIRRFEIHFFSSVPSIWRVLELGSVPPPGEPLRRVHCASAPLLERSLRFMQNWCAGATVMNTYGLSEAASWVAGSELTKNSQTIGFIGKPWGAEFAILAGEALTKEPGIAGEICLKSPSIPRAYLDGEAFSAVEGFFRTGDVGELNEQGALILTGRISDFINRGGMKVSPHEVRHCLESHPDVAEAWVGSVASEVWGETVAVALVPVDPKNFSLPDLRAWADQRLSAPKCPTVWKILEALPRNPNGKVNRDRMTSLLIEAE